MSLLLYGHPFSSCSQKVLIALYENAIDFEPGFLEPHTEHVPAWQQRWPLRKMPLLVDGERQLAETTIIIEYLHLTRPGPVALLPADPLAERAPPSPALSTKRGASATTSRWARPSATSVPACRPPARRSPACRRRAR